MTMLSRVILVSLASLIPMQSFAQCESSWYDKGDKKCRKKGEQLCEPTGLDCSNLVSRVVSGDPACKPEVQCHCESVYEECVPKDAEPK